MTIRDMAARLRSDGIGNVVYIAALLGNFEAESGLQANNLQNSYNQKYGVDDAEYTERVNSGRVSKTSFTIDGSGYGLAQWTFWSRKQALWEWTRGRDLPIDSIEAQLDFAAHELMTNYKGLHAQLTVCTDLKTSVSMILKQYEKPADQSESVVEKRYLYAKKIYDAISGPYDDAADRKEILRGVCDKIRELLKALEEEE